MWWFAEWFADWVEMHRREKKIKHSVKMVYKVMNKKEPTKKHQIGYLTFPKYGTFTWIVGPVKIVRNRIIRGDTIDVLLNDEKDIIAAWADQSFQYLGFLGRHDFSINEEKFKNIGIILEKELQINK